MHLMFYWTWLYEMQFFFFFLKKVIFWLFFTKRFFLFFESKNSQKSGKIGYLCYFLKSIL